MSKYQNYKFGEEALMPEGQPFRLAIEGVDTEYTLRHRIGDDGKIRMSLDVADPVTDRRSMLQDARPVRRPVDDDEGDFDSHTGLLRDGRRIRVPLPMMDSNLRGRGTPSDPIIITTGCNLDREFYPDGTPRNRRDAEPRRSRRTRQTDQTTVTDTGGDHRPGFRVGDASGQAAVVDAYNEMVADMNDAWKGPERRAQDASDARHVTADAPPRGVTAADWAREQGIREMTDAWRPRPHDADPSGLANSTGASTRRAETPPAGAYAKAGLGVKAGDPCQENGVGGVVIEKDGWLFCKTRQPTTRSAPPSGDAMIGDRAAQDQAYREYCDQLTNAWRT